MYLGKSEIVLIFPKSSIEELSQITAFYSFLPYRTEEGE